MSPWILYDPGRQVALFLYGISEVANHTGLYLYNEQVAPGRRVNVAWPICLALTYCAIAVVNIVIYKKVHGFYDRVRDCECYASQGETLELKALASYKHYGSRSGEK
jgi:hypothetical protein